MRAVLTIVAALSLTGCEIGDVGPVDRYQTDFHYTYDLQPSGRIDAESFNGAIEIAGWDQNKVEITGTKYGSTEERRDAVKIDVHNTPNSVEIRAVKPSSFQGNMGARFTMHVPRGAAIGRVDTSNGDIKVRDVSTAAHLTTSNGPITVANVGGDVDAHSSNGALSAEAIGGGATLKTSNGHVRAEGIGGPLEAETTNSGISVRLDKAPASATKLKTMNGSIELTLGSAPKGDIRAETMNSGITLRLPDNTGAHVVADTSNGSISSDFSVAAKPGEDEEKTHLDGTIGSGGPTITLTTGNGAIRILKGNAN